jgi:Fur family ferric uptake transcriptional regulator
MKEQEIEELLVHHGVRPTANRIVVARALAEAGRPMTLTELEYRILTIDKSGVFRALTLFRDHHLVHLIEDGGDGVRYELCRSHSDHEDDDLHVHFFCERCHRTYCLEQTPVPQVEVPDGFMQTSVNYIVKGVCAHCKRKTVFTK